MLFEWMCQSGERQDVTDDYDDGVLCVLSLPLFLYWIVPAYLKLYKVMFYFLSYVLVSKKTKKKTPKVTVTEVVYFIVL